jgi:hypothetical protein
VGEIETTNLNVNIIDNSYSQNLNEPVSNNKIECHSKNVEAKIL